MDSDAAEAEVVPKDPEVPESIARLSSFFELVPGDILFTGTPSGVSKIVLGDNIKGKIDGIGYIEINII